VRKIILRAANKNALLPLQLFAQILEELLFDHSDDSYKAPALNTHSRVKELRTILSDIYISNVPYQTATPFIEELVHSIKTDKVLIEGEIALMLEVLDEFGKTLADQEKAMALISVLEGYVENYFQKLIPALMSTLEGDLKDKQRLYRLTADFVVECEVRGHSRRYVYAETKRIKKHLYSNGTVNVQEVLDDFFGSFTKEINKYEVYFAGISPFTSLDIISRFGVVYKEDFEDVELPGVVANYIEQRKQEQCNFYGVVLEARDGMRAREKAEKLLELFASALVFCNHSNNFHYHSEGVVFNKSNNMTYLLSSPPNAMHMKSDGEEGASERFKLIDEVIQQNKDHLRSIFKLFNVFRLHRLGIRSSDSVNQLLDLWASLEGFMSRPGKDVARILHFSNQLSAVLTLTYAEKLFSILLAETLASSKKAAELVSSIDGESQLEKVVKLVVAIELVDKRKELAEIVGESNPLLCFRIWQLNKRFGSRKAVGETLRAHQKKITWQICRIYHARNALMHTAEMPEYLPTLVEHLHSYTDSLFWAITKLSVRSNHVINIDGVMATLAVQERMLLSEYEKSKDEECNIENSLGIVFGRTNPLRPKSNGPGS